MGAQY